ncbi:MAG: hypothetical protein KAX66_01870 [Propionivibrio sp.]|nr:hypothetical protein [Propionivibrio sp.]
MTICLKNKGLPVPDACFAHRICTKVVHCGLACVAAGESCKVDVPAKISTIQSLAGVSPTIERKVARKLLCPSELKMKNPAILSQMAH